MTMVMTMVMTIVMMFVMSAGRNRAGQGKETTRCSLAGWLFPSYSHIQGVPRKVVHRILRVLSGLLFQYYCHLCLKVEENITFRLREG